MNPELLMKKNTTKKVSMKKYFWPLMKKFRQQSTSSRKGKASDNDGIRAEDIKTCDNVTEVSKQEAVVQKHGTEYE